MSKNTKGSRKNANRSMVEALKNGAFSKGSTLSHKDIYEKLTKEYNGKQVQLLKIEELEEAPEDWNFFPPVDENKMVEMVESIEQNGLLHPILVWEKDNGKYMILAGHNRTKAFQLLYDITQEEKFLEIPAFIYKKEEINEEEAKDILLDTNYVQRVLTKEIIAKAVLVKYKNLNKNKEISGRKRDIIAEKLNISGRLVEYYKKLHELIPQLQSMVYDNKISLESSRKLLYLDKEMQTWVYENYKEELNNKIIQKFKKEMTKEEIQSLFEEKEEYVSITMKIPKEFQQEFMEMVQHWMEDKK